MRRWRVFRRDHNPAHDSRFAYLGGYGPGNRDVRHFTRPGHPAVARSNMAMIRSENNPGDSHVILIYDGDELCP